MKSVAVVGGGASGTVAAITAASMGASVTIFEAQSALCNKILSTGNGRCNLSNTDIHLKYYHSASTAGHSLISSILSDFPTERITAFFESIGLSVRQGREAGCLYPVTMQAKSVRDALLAAVKRYGIEVITNCYMDEIGLHNVRKRFDKIIISTGSIAGLSKKALDALKNNDTYSLPQSLGHTIATPIPALVGMRCSGNFFQKTEGIRTHAAVRFYDKKLLAKDFGELQLTDYGLSGIAVFNCSQPVGRALANGRSVRAVIDFLPFIQEDLAAFTKKRMAIFHLDNGRGISAAQYFIGLINETLLGATLAQLGIDYHQKTDSAAFFLNCLQQLKTFEVNVIATNGFDKAQVTSGGIDCGQILLSLESAHAKDVYFCGEVIDADGVCGGYNLHWAWASGIKAGTSACFGLAAPHTPHGTIP